MTTEVALGGRPLSYYSELFNLQYYLWQFTIPLISNDAVDLGKKRLLEHELAELFHERPQSSLLHGWNELVMQATLSEQEMCRSLSGAGFEILLE